MNRALTAVIVLLVVVGAGWFGYTRHLATVAREAAEDKAVIAFVFDDMVPRMADDASKACSLPRTEFTGSIGLKTHDAIVEISSFDTSVLPPGWSAETKKCVQAQFVTRTQRPTSITVPNGREYEVDIEVVFPASVASK